MTKLKYSKAGKKKEILTKKLGLLWEKSNKSKNKYALFIANLSYYYNKIMVFTTYQRMRVKGKS